MNEMWKKVIFGIDSKGYGMTQRELQISQPFSIGGAIWVINNENTKYILTKNYFFDLMLEIAHDPEETSILACLKENIFFLKYYLAYKQQLEKVVLESRGTCTGSCNSWVPRFKGFDFSPGASRQIGLGVESPGGYAYNECTHGKIKAELASINTDNLTDALKIYREHTGESESPEEFTRFFKKNLFCGFYEHKYVFLKKSDNNYLELKEMKKQTLTEKNYIKAKETLFLTMLHVMEDLATNNVFRQQKHYRDWFDAFQYYNMKRDSLVRLSVKNNKQELINQIA